MAVDFAGSIASAFSWRWREDGGQPQDKNKLDYSQAIANGCEDYEAEAVWYKEAVALLEGNSTTFDLTALTRTILGDTHSTTFVRVKALLILSAATSTGELVVGGAASNEWLGPFRSAGNQIVLGIGSPFQIAAARCGWIVDATHKNLKLLAQNGDVTYSIALIGTLNACVGTCSLPSSF